MYKHVVYIADAEPDTEEVMPRVKFDWEGTIEQCLLAAKGNELSMKKLNKKVGILSNGLAHFLTQLLTFCSHFQKHFLERRCLYFD